MASNSAEYMREWRQTPNGRAALDAQRKRAKAHRLAVQDLIKRHESEFEKLFINRLEQIIVDN